MKDYESIIILNPNMEEAEAEKIVQRMQDVITGNGGQVSKVERWGKKRLAYIVKKQKKGEYVLLNFKGQPGTVAELERNYKMTDAIIKYLTIRLEKEAIAHLARLEAAQAAAARPEAPIAPEAPAAEAPAEQAPAEAAGTETE